MIHITDGQSDKILDFIAYKNIIDDNHRQSLKDNLETYEMRVLGDKRYVEHLGKHNRVIIPAEDSGYKEFVITESEKYRDTEGLKAEVYASASYLLLKKAKVIKPTSLKDQSPSTAVSFATNGTEWVPGIIEGKGTRSFTISKHTNPFAFLKTIAKEFELELNFRTETDGKRVIGRYVDLLERVGQWRGREVEFGKDLIGIRRNEKTDNIFTALVGLGPEREDGTRLEVFVEDKEALQRWGRPHPVTGELQHLIDVYEPESSRDSMTKTELTQYTKTELNKRINAVVEYESTIADLENVPGMENKKIRFGDTIKIKDTDFNPPLYLEARVHTQDRSVVDKSKKQVKLGDYIEYTEEEVRSIWKELQAEIRRKLARLISVTILSSAGDVFKNGEGETELTVKTFLSGEEVDQDASIYNYYWTKRDKRGVPVNGWSATGKAVSVVASDIDEKATYQVEVSQDGTTLNVSRITISNVFDGEDGEQGPAGPNRVDGNTDFAKGYDPTKIKFGGRNLWPFTDYESVSIDNILSNYEYTKSAGEPFIRVASWDSLKGTPVYGKKILSYVSTVGAVEKEYFFNPLENGNRYLTLKPNTEYTFSMDYYHGGGIDNLFFIVWAYNNDGSGRVAYTSSYISQTYSAQFKHFEFQFETDERIYYETRIYIRPDNSMPVGTAVYYHMYQPQLEEGTKASPYRPAPEDGRIYATEVSEAAYLDALNDAEDYMQKNGIMQGKDYNGVSITNQEGIVTARADGLVRTVQNSTTGTVIQRRASKSAPWEDVLYFDTEGNGTFAGSIQAIAGYFGDNLRLQNGKMEIVRPDGAVYMQNGLIKDAPSVNGINPMFMDSEKQSSGGFSADAFMATDGYFENFVGFLDGRQSGFVDVRNSNYRSSLRIQRYYFVHSARYFVLTYRSRTESGGRYAGHDLHQHLALIYDSQDNKLVDHTVPKNTTATVDLIVDLGVPDYKSKWLDFRIGWAASWGNKLDYIRFRINNVLQTDFI